jgi:hypothetical protein
MEAIIKDTLEIVELEKIINSEKENLIKKKMIVKLSLIIKNLNNKISIYENEIDDKIYNSCEHQFEYYCERNERTKNICTKCNYILY